MEEIDVAAIIRRSFVREVEVFDELPSTQDRARERAADISATIPLLVVAGRQTAGRGRGDHRWWSGEGNLAFSLVVPSPFIERQQTPLASLGSALAVVEALRPRLGETSIGLHWPNDVFAAGRKLAGVLVHATAQGRLVIGIGINIAAALADAPAEVRARATSVADLASGTHDRWDVLVDVLQRLDDELTTLAGAPQRIAERADAACLQHGQEIVVDTGGDVVAGRCAGIASDGGLILDSAGGRRVVHSGTLRQSP